MRRLPFLAVSLLAAVALSACNSTQDVLEPSAMAPQPQGQGDVASVQPAAPATSSTTPTATQSAAIATNARIQFAPIVGTSVEAASVLSERLASRARERGIALARSSDTATTHVLKGYFTPLSEGKETTVIYVWDVYDPAGNRVHRITGQHKAPSGGSEGWSAVSPATMQTIADATIDQLATWLAARTG
ncbi:hypothetical protein ACG873_18280 [Mesorhizobium sp. AaZ16]|uniref:hypothetical protein n=1 Tax=Mesorhizobium sp. AaZ16 TaxID=3402289 RepID=UPI00374EC2B5